MSCFRTARLMQIESMEVILQVPLDAWEFVVFKQAQNSALAQKSDPPGSPEEPAKLLLCSQAGLKSSAEATLVCIKATY